MRLLRRTDSDGTPHRLPGYAALARADMADARRRRPDVDLSDYAAARGLAFRGSDCGPGWAGALPDDPRLQFNVMDGALGDGRVGCLFHWVRPWPVDSSGDAVGTFYGKLWNPPTPKGWWKPDRTDIPYIGWLLNPPDRGEPTHENAIGVPCTAAVTRVPEAALLPAFAIDNRARPRHTPGFHREKLAERGLRGFELVADDAAPPAAVLDRLLAPGAPLAGVIGGGAGHALWELLVRDGLVSLRRNGFAKEPQELDALVRALRAAADALAAACLAEARPQPFDAPLPGVDWPPQGRSLSGRFPPSPWLESIHGLAAQLGMTLEEPAAYHRAFPSLPVPGRAFAVLRGTLPGTSVPARLVLHATRAGRPEDGHLALALPAAPGAAADPAAGSAGPTAGAPAHAVRDGVVVLWEPREPGTLGDVPGFIERAFAAAVERGLVTP